MTSKDESITHDEALSALMDGELGGPPRARVLGRLLEDPVLRARWERYHAGRATLEGTEPALVSAGFSERVSAAIEREPPVAAPGRLREPGRPGWFRPAAGLAVAAVMAFVTVGGLLVLRNDGFESPAPVVAGTSGGTPTVITDAAAPMASGTFGEGMDRAEQNRVRQRLTIYLNSHNRFADAGEMPNVMPSSRLVGFNAAP